MDVAFALFTGWDENAFVMTSAKTHGLYSLLPNNVPRLDGRDNWIKIENDPRLRSELNGIRDNYARFRMFDKPWGLIDGPTWTSGQPVNTGDESERAWRWLDRNSGRAGSIVRLLYSLQQSGWLRLFAPSQVSGTEARRLARSVRDGIRKAERASARVGDFVHPNTWSLWGTGLPTDAQYIIRRNRSTSTFEARRWVTDEGDGTLEMPSARALSDRFRGEEHLEGMIHADVMSQSRDARRTLIETVYRALVAAHRADTRTGRYRPRRRR